jgi:hypothetical protein
MWGKPRNNVAHPGRQPWNAQLHITLGLNNFSKKQIWHHYALADLCLECYHREWDAFLHCTLAMDKRRA